MELRALSDESNPALRPQDLLVIFDCDGVLVDSDRLSLRLQAEAITALGWPLTTEECMKEFLGIGMEATLRRIEQRIGKPIPSDWQNRLESQTYALFEQELESVAGIEEALTKLQEIGVATCVASSGTHEKMARTLGITGLYERFQGRIFSSKEVKRGKPAPDLFLRAARSMGFAADRCIVVEDSPAGIAAAQAAQMTALAYAGSTPAQWLRGQSTVVFDDMRDLPRLIERLI